MRQETCFFGLETQILVEGFLDTKRNEKLQFSKVLYLIRKYFFPLSFLNDFIWESGDTYM